ELLQGRPSFEDQLRREIARNGGRAMVFVHGYRNSFDSAVYRMTQIVHDAGYEGTPVLFSWASAGRTADYIYDTNSATAARDALEETLRTVVDAGATRVDIVAHSLGTWVAMETLRQLAIGGDRTLSGRLGDVVLASPDIDVDVFKSQMRRYGKPKEPFLVLTSSDDRALRISRIVAGGRSRVGDGYYAGDLADLGLVVVDLSNVSAGDRLNHSRFADNPVIVELLGARLTEDGAATDLTDAIAGLTRGVGDTLTSAAEIVVTTPFRVLSVVVGDR
ncbi:MAG: alpha/beta fold hydrolase, partial [Rhizobiaceae bacterium]|nr:alpha/beta fold hydrolase [Rhizobiaceae bacterium]